MGWDSRLCEICVAHAGNGIEIEKRSTWTHRDDGSTDGCDLLVLVQHRAK